MSASELLSKDNEDAEFDEEHALIEEDDGAGVSAEVLSQPLPQILLRLFGRTPRLHEVQAWQKMIRKGLTARAFIKQVSNKRSFKSVTAARHKWPPGHFFSPIVNPELVEEYWKKSAHEPLEGVADIPIDLDAMTALWERHRAFTSGTRFPKGKQADRRFYVGGPFGWGDAYSLRMMLNEFRPKRVVEIGSGFTTACMLDAADDIGLNDFRVTCIEPYPARLKKVLRPEDFESRVTLEERPVQLMPLDIFRTLEKDDILFIDSTHVLKTGSDVHYELFYVLPALKPGVVVHFHDCRFPFEYTPRQVFEKNHSWNEAYAVRALLMNSNRHRVIFSGSLFEKQRKELIRETQTDFLRNCGSSLWLQTLPG
jgi:predicted O-methyltransferase YrrM